MDAACWAVTAHVKRNVAGCRDAREHPGVRLQIIEERMRERAARGVVVVTVEIALAVASDPVGMKVGRLMGAPFQQNQFVGILDRQRAEE